eukprot:TRINITY_DN5966_c0_g2_i1.p1 TRINITY_DN5966_c0_g2~~TRINITY_DN5966_c0_g2_i1.p1  ORF type:complete len:517 (-),score=92.11 TRINITY_DN5966_c0_g2_i1:155-1705(-)
MEDERGTCCSICMEAFKEAEGLLPRMLHCGHSFCEGCLAKLPSITRKTIACPKCGQETPIKEGNIRLLPRNFDLLDLLAEKKGNSDKKKQQQKNRKTCASCLDSEKKDTAATVYCATCDTFFCDSCNAVSHPTAFIQKKHIRMDVNEAPKPTRTCKVHPSNPLEIWCVKDATPICTLCYIVGTHKGHDCLTLEEGWLKMKSEAEKELDGIEALIAGLEKGMKSQIEDERTRKEGVKKAKEEIDKHFEELIAAIRERKNVMTKELIGWDKEKEAKAAMAHSSYLQAILAAKEKGKAIQQSREDKEAWIDNTLTSGNKEMGNQQELLENAIEMVEVSVDEVKKNNVRQLLHDSATMKTSSRFQMTTGPHYTVSPSGLVITKDTEDIWNAVAVGQQGWKEGIHEWSVRFIQGPYVMFGIAPTTISRDKESVFTQEGWYMSSWNGALYSGLGYYDKVYAEQVAVGASVLIRLDMDAGTISFTVAGLDKGVAYRNIPKNELTLCLLLRSPNSQLEVINHTR